MRPLLEVEVLKYVSANLNDGSLLCGGASAYGDDECKND